MRHHQHHIDPDIDHPRDGAHGHRRRGPAHRLRGPHGHGRGRQRARRGAVAVAILVLLDERPMHGYELIGALADRSGGRWQPSPGAVYPALQRLEDRGFVRPIDGDDHKRRFELTDAGTARVAALREAGEDEPWADDGQAPRGDLRRAVAELVGPSRQIGRFGSAEQIAAAVAALRTATDALYRILADGPHQADGDAVAGDDDHPGTS